MTPAICHPSKLIYPSKKMRVKSFLLLADFWSVGEFSLDDGCVVVGEVIFLSMKSAARVRTFYKNLKPSSRLIGVLGEGVFSVVGRIDRCG